MLKPPPILYRWKRFLESRFLAQACAQLMLNMTSTAAAELCFLCGKSAFVECQECHQAWFCSPEHLEELHQPPKCFPIKVASSEAVGRYLVATRDLDPLDLVIADMASPTGPLHQTKVRFIYFFFYHVINILIGYTRSCCMLVKLQTYTCKVTSLHL